MSILFPVDYMTMNGRSLLFATKTLCLAIMLGILAGCVSAPVEKPPAQPATSPNPAEEDVWALLARGDAGARSFFSGKLDVNSTDSMGRTPLHYAAENKDSGLADFLIALGAKTEVQDSEQRTPLSISAEKIDAATAKILATAGANIHYQMKGSAGAQASGTNSPALIALRRGGEFLSALLNQSTLNSTDPSGRTILHLAAEEGNFEAVNTILGAGTVSFTKDYGWKTALDIAFEKTGSRNHAEIAETLILAGADSEKPISAYFTPAVKNSNFNIRSPDGMAPLHHLAREGFIGYLAYAMERGADVNIKNASGAAPLHEAVRSGKLDIIETLLNNGAEINAQDAKGNSVLHIAAPYAAVRDITELLISRNVNLNLRDEHGDSPFHIAILLNRGEDVIRTMLQHNADLSLRNLDGKTPLYLAIEKNRENLIPLLLEYNSDIFAADNSSITPYEKALKENTPLAFRLITNKTVLQYDSEGNTLLHLTVKAAGDIGLLSAILDRGASVNARNKAGDTALSIAVRQNAETAGTLLLARNADIFAANARGESPLYLSFPPPETVNSDYRRWILTPGTLSAKDGLGNSVLHYAAQWRMDYWLPLIILKGANIEASNATGETPLFFAVKQNSPSTIELLIRNGANIEARDTVGNSALHMAVRWNTVESAKKLIDLGLNINSHALNGKTPLHDSIRWGMPEMEKLLLSRGADFEARDADGNTALMEAVLAGNPAAMEELVKLGADINTRNFKGDTALHLGAAMNRIDISTLLLTWGVSIHARNANDRTPYQNAIISSQRLVRIFLTKDRINSSDDFGSSPLHIAVQEQAPISVIESIIELGARLNSVDAEGRTPLRLALDLDLSETAGFLTKSGSDVFYAARDGKTPAEIALDKGEAELRALFSGSAITSKDTSGNTILHYAARQGNVAVISQLLSLGAQKDVRNIASESPADIALRWRHPEAAALLF